MKTMRLAILTRDKELLDVCNRQIRLCLRGQGIEPALHCYEEPALLQKAIQESRQFDMVFLDMTEKSGEAVAQQLHTALAAPAVVFLVPDFEKLDRMLRLQPFRVIRRESIGEELGECLRAALRELPNSVHRPWLILDSSGNLYRIAVDTIRYMESVNKQLRVVTVGGELMLHCNLATAEELLEAYQFIRIHKSFLVNANEIVRLENQTAVLRDGTVLPISRYRTQAVRERFLEAFRWDLV